VESLGLLDVAWRVVLASTFALIPGLLFWTVVLGLAVVVRRLARRRMLSRPASDAARP
jgi:hypothetical protein